LRRSAFGALALVLTFRTLPARACEGAKEQVVGYAIGSDRYAVRVQPAAASETARFVIRRLSSGEPIDQVACSQTGACELTDVLGMRSCSFARLGSSRTTHGLVLEPAPEGGPRWNLSLDATTGRVPLLVLHGDGELDLRVAHIVGRHVLLVVRENVGGSCPVSREWALLLSEGDLRPGRQRVEGAPRETDLGGEAGLDEAPAPRPATPFHPMPIRMLLKAARTAAASGMDHLAACWIEHNAFAMSARGRRALFLDLSGDRTLARFADRALRGGRVALTTASRPTKLTR
jgi:hypothetical protein